eukprot:TRINITY_DN14243_c0_g1_i1.p1 TRINITY_DN14243_c0_g1~~TRINITY_DN14243_c0_g1_i1.p1  ORF type:complete len:296 (-),score=55.93 TRINITY_DN14243_c0_g1_i1:17-904(-)
MSTRDTCLLFIFGGFSCQVAAFFTNPIDTTKIRLQLQGELSSTSGAPKYKGFFHGAWVIAREEGIGFRGLQRGLGASLLREGTYSSLRMGGYDVMKNLLQTQDPTNTPFWKKLVAGGSAGMFGAAIANPTDLVKVRMQAENSERVYRNCFHGFYDIYKTEGIRGLYKGVGPTTQRAILLTAAQLATYDEIKNGIKKVGLINEGIALHFLCATFSGLASALVTSPVDLIKTRIMNQEAGNLKYRNSFDCLVKTMRAEGPLGLYKGFFPNWIRIGPHTVITFMVNEQLRKMAGLRAV